MTNSVTALVVALVNQLTDDSDTLLLPASVAVDTLSTTDKTATVMVALEMLDTSNDVSTVRVFERDIEINSSLELGLEIWNLSLDC